MTVPFLQRSPLTNPLDEVGSDAKLTLVFARSEPFTSSLNPASVVVLIRRLPPEVMRIAFK
jgi:hypothetical protein